MRNTADTKATSPNHHHTLRCLDLFLRLSSIPLTVASMWVMTKNKQDNDVYGKVEFSNISGLKYLVSINAISAGYALVSSLFSYLRWFSGDWVFFILDQAVAYLMITSVSAVGEVLYLVNEGDREVSWSEVCSSYGKFCSGVKVSFGLHLTALVCFLVLSLISAYRLFTKFDPPYAPSMDAGGQGVVATS